MRHFILLCLLLSLAVYATPESVIHGHVIEDATGTPLPGVRVSLTLINNFNLRTRGGVTTTDKDGAFEFIGIAPSRYSLLFEAPDFLRESVFGFEASQEIVARLRRAASISGHVFDSSGRPIANALVEVGTKSYVYGEASFQPVSDGFAETHRGGIYQLHGLAPGRYYVRASCAGYDIDLFPNAPNITGAQSIRIVAGDARNEINFRLRSGRRFRVEGRLIDGETGQPATAASLRAHSADLVAGTFVDGTIHGGHFVIKGMKPGGYFFRFDWVGATNNVTRTAVIPFQMGNADQTGITLTAVPPATVAGRLSAKGRTIPPNLTVYLENVAPVVLAMGGNSSSGGDVGGDGTFSIEGVEAGQYYLRIHSGNPPLFYVHERNPIIVAGAPVTDVELELIFPAGSVSGRAVDRSGRALQGAAVVLQSVDPQKRTAELYRHVYGSGVEGRYTITGLAPGDYLIYAWKGDHGLIGDPDLFDQAIKRAQRVTIAPGSTINLDAIEFVEE